MQFALASEIANRVGNRTLANTVHCNSGLAHEARADLVAACNAHEDALRGAREAGDLRGEVQFSTYLSSALSRAGRLTESEELLTRALQLATVLEDRLLHAMVLVSAAELSACRNDPAAARAEIKRARDLAREHRLDQSRELGRRLVSVEALIRD